MCYNWKNSSYLKQYVTVGNIDHTSLHVSVLENKSQLQKCVTVEKMGHTWKNASQLKKWVLVKNNVLQLKKV